MADRLGPEGKPAVLILVGGSLLAWHDLRASTEDVDSLQRIDDEDRAAAASVTSTTTWSPTG